MIVGTSIITRDISERRRAQERQSLLLAELSHRVKNTLATVLSIANQTLSRAKSLDEFARSFRGRIQALAAAHSLLTAVDWEVAALRVLVEQALRPYASGDRSNVQISGDEVVLRPSAALTFSLVLHELATNAAKYGALQKPGGFVAVDCRVRSNGGRELHLHWAESGGPPVKPPVRRGFGLELIERSVAHELGGQASWITGSMACLRDHRAFDRGRRHCRRCSAFRVKSSSIRLRSSRKSPPSERSTADSWNLLPTSGISFDAALMCERPLGNWRRPVRKPNEPRTVNSSADRARVRRPARATLLDQVEAEALLREPPGRESVGISRRPCPCIALRIASSSAFFMLSVSAPCEAGTPSGSSGARR